MRNTSSTRFPKNPVDLIAMFKGNPDYISMIKKTYSRNEFRKDHLFYSNSIVNDSIKRGLTILDFVFHLQLLFGKDIYIPGIGLYGAKPLASKLHYSFRRDFAKLPVSKIQRKVSFPRQVLDEETGKLSYDLFNKKTLGIMNKERLELYSNNITKADMLTNVMRKYVKDKDLDIQLLEPYTGLSDFGSIAMDAKTHKDKDLRSYLEHINMDDCLYSVQILEDLLYTIGYIAAQEMQPHTT